MSLTGFHTETRTLQNSFTKAMAKPTTIRHCSNGYIHLLIYHILSRLWVDPDQLDGKSVERSRGLGLSAEYQNPFPVIKVP